MFSKISLVFQIVVTFLTVMKIYEWKEFAKVFEFSHKYFPWLQIEYFSFSSVPSDNFGSWKIKWRLKTLGGCLLWLCMSRRLYPGCF